ncbi:MAG: alpha/beta fold hydrolase, partial [Alphaproteobacteria bacterium]|nr:alpha/beta fold hydrolase [Alphaproteobacteria bacterium]
MPTISTPGGAIAYSRSGRGTPLVLLLPQSAGPVGVAPFAQGLASGFAVIRYDQRGTGQSPPPSDPEAVSMADRGQEVADLLAALGIARAHLVCHSTGCGIGLAFASAHPERVERLALIAPWSHGDAFLTDMQTLRIAAAAELSAQTYARFNASLLFPP